MSARAGRFELLDEDGAFGYFGGGMGPKWTIDPPQAALPDLRSLMPALLAILVAVGFRMVIPGLIAGIIVGALVGADGSGRHVERFARCAHRRLLE